MKDCQFIGTTDAARLLNCSPDRVRQLEREGRLTAEKLPNGQRIFRCHDVKKLAQERNQKNMEAGIGDVQRSNG